MKPSLLPPLAALLIPVFSAAGVFALSKTLEENAAQPSAPSVESKQETSPAPKELPTTEVVAQGRNLYVQSCARCHGNDAKGNGEDDDGPDLHGLRISNTRISSAILKGVKGEMPSFAKKFSAADVTTLVAYLRSLPAD
jgi:mono/diheme cytochrome c family protein